MVPLCLSFLSVSSYGTWQVIYSIFSWTTFFDFGLGNGLKSRLSEAIAREDFPLATQYVSTHYLTLILIALILVGLFSIVHSYINWHAMLNVGKDEIYLTRLIGIGIVIFAARLVLDSINSILLSYQRAAVVQLNTFLGAVLSLAGVWLLTHMNVRQPLRLPMLGLVISLMPTMLSLAVSFYYFRGEFAAIRPSIRRFYSPYVKRLFSLGGQFFIIQIAALVIFSTDSFLIAHLFGPSQVTLYNVVAKFFSCFTIVWNIIITPYWVAFGEAYLKRDYTWIKKTVSTLLGLWLGLVLALLVAVQVSDQVYRWWVGDQIFVPRDLSLAMAASVAITCLSNIFAYFVNGVTKIRLQLVIGVVAAAINIPLAVFFSKTLNMGLKGIILATGVCISFTTLLVAIQYHKIINRRASGIWDR